MKNTTKAITTIGSAVASTFAVNAVNAESNPFAMQALNSGYMQLAQSDKAGEMKCGSKMKMNKQKEAACGEGQCGGMMENGKMKKGLENACGSMMKGESSAKKVKNKGYSVSKTGWGKKKSAPDAMEKGMDMGKGKEGKCGEGMCGGMMQGDKMKKGMEGMCGDMMKGKEGSCGMGMKGMGDMQGMDGMKSGEASCGAMISPEKATGK